MAPKSAKMAPKRPPNAAKMGSWLDFGSFWDNGSQIEENLAKKAMLSRSWAVLGDLGRNLGCTGRCWEQDGAKEATRSARMSLQRLPDGKTREGGVEANRRAPGACPDSKILSN